MKRLCAKMGVASRVHAAYKSNVFLIAAEAIATAGAGCTSPDDMRDHTFL